jgi:hypothetical protein
VRLPYRTAHVSSLMTTEPGGGPATYVSLKAGAAQSVWRWATGWTAGVRFATGARPALLGVKRQELEADHSSPSLAEVKNGLHGVYLHLLPLPCFLKGRVNS